MQDKLLQCAGCGIGYSFWVMTEEPCEDSGDCHDWEDSPNDEDVEGENVIVGGQSAYKVGGFITWD